MSKPSQRAAFDAVLALPHARVGLKTDAALLGGLWLLPPDTPTRAANSPLAAEVARQVEAYRQDPGFEFELPMATYGTPFQQRVWARLRAIAPGAPCRYGELARELGSGARAVANACRANPYPLVVPCHRVIGSRDVGGFVGRRDGWPLVFKRWLLEHERRG